MNNNISMEKRLPVAGIFSYNVYGVAYQLQEKKGVVSRSCHYR